MNRYDFLNYIRNTFNVNSMSYELIGKLYDALFIYTSTKAPIDYNGRKLDYYIPIIIDYLNECYIDVTIEELIENGVIR